MLNTLLSFTPISATVHTQQGLSLPQLFYIIPLPHKLPFPLPCFLFYIKRKLMMLEVDFLWLRKTKYIRWIMKPFTQLRVKFAS